MKRKLIALTAAAAAASVIMSVNVSADTLVTKNGVNYRYSDSGEELGKYTGFMRTEETGEYFYSEDGTAAEGWRRIGKYDYYFGENGVMATGKVTINGAEYTFSSGGKLTASPRSDSNAFGRAVKAASREYDLYCGKYYDSENGVYVIAATDTAKMRDLLKKAAESEPSIGTCRINVAEGKFTWSQLLNVQEKCTRQKYAEIVSSEVDTKNNCVYINFAEGQKKSAVDKAKKYITEKLDGGKCAVFGYASTGGMIDD